MQRKNTKKALKVLVSLVIAFAMIGIPASVFVPTTAATDANEDGGPESAFPFGSDHDVNEPIAGDPYGSISVFSKNFDGTMDMTNWTIMAGYPTNPYGSPDTVTWENTSQTTWTDIFEYNYSEPNSMFLNASDSDSMVTASIDATGITGNLTLTFYSTIWQTGSVDVLIYDGAGTLIDTVTVTDRQSWNQFEVDLAGYEGTTFQLAFNVVGETETVFIDDVEVTGSNRPDYDIAVEGFTNLNCGGQMNTEPKELEVDVANWGSEDAGLVPFHFQVYHEQPLEVETYKLWDMEECVLNTWVKESYDEHPESTWYWTEKRANSPTHSFHTQPDNLPSYEAYSNDSLILEDWFHINETVDGEAVSSAYISLAHWCEGEFDGTNAVDYGTIYVINATGRYKVGGPIYDTDGEWETLYGEDGVDISQFIGQDIKIEFNWKSDATNNYEGWYVDDVNIDYSYTAPQPLVWDGYKLVDLPGETNKTVTSQLDWEPEEDGQYYIQVYVANNWTTSYEDYDMLNNEVNCSIWIGDICDAAVDDITAPADVELDHEVGYKEIPINVTVRNNGTLEKDIPVTVSAQHLLTEYIVNDDVESGVLDGWQFMWTGVGPSEDLWTVTEDQFFSPTHSWSMTETGTPLGHAKLWEGTNPFQQGGVKWESKIKWNLPPGAGVTPVFLAEAYYWDMSVGGAAREMPFTGSSGWTTFDADEFVRNNDLYWEIVPADSFADYCQVLYDLFAYQYETEEAWENLQIGFLIEAPSGLSAGEGFWFDNFQLYTEYAGATAWEETKSITLAPGESGYIEYTWNTTEYCDYLITGDVTLGCDQDPSNDEASTATRIHEWIYTDDAEDVEYEDNTCGDPAQWKIVEECSLCPDDNFWYNGDDVNYTNNRDDVLANAEAINMTGYTEAYLNFSTYYYIEEDWDYGYIEVSNDSGDTWFILDELTGNSSGTWQNLDYHLLPGVTTLFSNYTGFEFIMPASFFTENMHFRFRFYSDAVTTEKGWYINDVAFNGYNGTWNILFEDDMEDVEESLYKWDTHYKCYGNHWHEEDNFGTPYPGLDDTAYWNGDNRTWIGTGTATSFGRGRPNTFNDAWSWSGIAGYFWFGDGDGGFYDGGAPGSGSYTITLDGSSWTNAQLDLTYWQTNFAFGTPTMTATLDVWDGTTSISTPLPNTADGVNNTVTVDISAFDGSSSVNFAINATGAGFDWMGLTSMYINASSVVIPDHEYYNNVDEKAIFSFDLTQAYEAILHFDQNYSFANEEDIGWVEVWTGSDWQPILMNKGSSDWSHAQLDITKYIDHEDMTKVRYRFVSDASDRSYGWLVDNVSIDGKVDYTAPTASHTLDPATPDGNNGWYTSDVTFTLSGTDNTKVDHIEYRINGGSWLTYTGPVTIDDDGEFTIDYKAIDQVGNEGSVNSFSFMIDSTAPTGSLDFPQTGYIYLFGNELMPRILFKDKALIIGGLTATASASDSGSGMGYVTFETSADSSNVVTPYEYNLPFYFPFGSDTLTISATDLAGNTATGLGSVDYMKIL